MRKRPCTGDTVGKTEESLVKSLKKSRAISSGHPLAIRRCQVRGTAADARTVSKSESFQTLLVIVLDQSSPPSCRTRNPRMSQWDVFLSTHLYEAAMFVVVDFVRSPAFWVAFLTVPWLLKNPCWQDQVRTGCSAVTSLGCPAFTAGILAV